MYHASKYPNQHWQSTNRLNHQTKTSNKKKNNQKISIIIKWQKKKQKHQNQLNNFMQVGKPINNVKLPK